VEIARSEKMATGTVPLLPLRSDVDFAFYEAHTIYGQIGIKVWICHGYVFGRKDKLTDVEPEEKKEQRRCEDLIGTIEFRTIVSALEKGKRYNKKTDRKFTI